MLDISDGGRYMRVIKKVACVLAVMVVVGGVAYGSYWYGKNHPTKSTISSSNSSSQKTSTTGISNQSATEPTQSAKLADACKHLELNKGTAEGTAGTIYWHAVITNNGDQDCSMAGYPAATMTDSQSASVTAASNPLYDVQLVTLIANGGKAHVVLGLPDPSIVDPGTTVCTQQSTSMLHLDLPGLTIQIQAPFSVSACDGFTVSTITAGV